MSNAVREADPEEYAGLVEFALREQPHLERVELAPMFFDDAFTVRRTVLVAHEGEAVVGFGLLGHFAMHEPGRRFLRVVVAATHLARGIGSSLHRPLAEALPADVQVVRTFTYDDDERAGSIAEHWGFPRVQRSITSRLRLADGVAPDLPDDVTVTSHPDFEFSDRAAVEEMFDRSQTNPERYSYGPMSLEKLASMVSDGETPVLLVVRVDGRPVGLSNGAIADGMSYIAFTGVDPAFRGRGLARLAKQAFHAEARRLGAPVCFTENEEHNTGIRALNAELGYEVLYGVWRHQRQL